MTPGERDRVAELFDRLETLERSPRDSEAEQTIAEGLGRAPNAVYALVQTALVQDEALRAASERIRELEAELGYEAPQPREGGFLDSMRDTIFGRDEPQRRAGSVPSVRASDAPMGTPAGFRTGGQMVDQGYRGFGQGETQSAGGSFLGTAAAAAAGVVGGALLAQSLKGLFGQGGGDRGHTAHGSPSGGGSLWGDPTGSGSGSGNLAREAGLDDIGCGVGGGPGGERYGALDASQEEFDTAEADLGDDGDFDFGDDDSDVA